MIIHPHPSKESRPKDQVWQDQAYTPKGRRPSFGTRRTGRARGSGRGGSLCNSNPSSRKRRRGIGDRGSGGTRNRCRHRDACSPDYRQSFASLDWLVRDNLCLRRRAPLRLDRTHRERALREGALHAYGKLRVGIGVSERGVFRAFDKGRCDCNAKTRSAFFDMKCAMLGPIPRKKKRADRSCG